MSVPIDLTIPAVLTERLTIIRAQVARAIGGGDRVSLKKACHLVIDQLEEDRKVLANVTDVQLDALQLLMRSWERSTATYPLEMQEAVYQALLGHPGEAEKDLNHLEGTMQLLITAMSDFVQRARAAKER